MRSILALFLTVALQALVCCDSHEKEPEPAKPPDKPEVVNTIPTATSVSVFEIRSNFAKIEWTKVVDPDGDNIFYTVSLDDSVYARDVLSLESLEFHNLKPSTLYTGAVTLTDKKSTPVVSTCTFTTKPYITLYSKLITKYVDRHATPFASCETGDGGYVIACSTGFDNNGDGTSVMCVDSLGVEQWHTFIEAHVNSTFSGSIRRTSDNGYIIASQSDIIKLTKTGKLSWKHRGIKKEYYSAIETNDGSFLATGMTYETENAGTITKFDKNGVLTWVKQYDTYYPGAMWNCNDIAKISENEFMVVGTELNVFGSQYRILVSSIDQDGEILWTKAYDNEYQAMYIGTKIHYTQTGDLVIGTSSLASMGYRYFRVLKIDKEGNLLWNRNFRMDGSIETDFKDLTLVSDGTFLVAGEWASYNHQWTAFMAKISPSGDLLWTREFKPLLYNDFVWLFGCVTHTADGGFFLAGYKGWVNYEDDATEKGLWLLKTDKDGYY